jgi:uncharacterized membrane protein
MIGSILVWWIASSFLGLLAFPLAWHFFDRLPDRGYGLSRALGILISGYIYWFGASLDILPNNLGGVIGAVILLGTASFLLFRQDWREIGGWLTLNRKIVITVELVFLAAFVGWSLVRAYNPEIQHTEKPMELAFLNSILSSESFPPKDPWLSGYAISYYYFGYILLAFMTRFTGVLASEAFNLGNALWFALTVIGAYSILCNLVSAGKKELRIFSPLLGPVFVVITGNLEVIFDILHHRHIFWEKLQSGELTSSFWTWLDIERLAEMPTSTPTWMPNRHLWWWQASRVVYDVKLTGDTIEMIDEFPFFSFLLADNHPHLLALPFVLLAVAFAFNLFQSRYSQSFRLAELGEKLRLDRLGTYLVGLLFLIGLIEGVLLLMAGADKVQALQSILKILALGGVLLAVGGGFLLIVLGRLEISLPGKDFWFAAWLFGALAFLNTWDFPFYLSLLLVVIFWFQWRQGGSGIVKRFLITAFALVVAGVLFYIPWYPGFSSQAGGILPNLIFPTRFQQFLVMFGPLILPIFVWLVRKVTVEHRIEEKRIALRVAVLVPLALFILSTILGFIAYTVVADDPTLSHVVFDHLGISNAEPREAFNEVIQALISRRITSSWTTILLGGMIFMIAGLLLQVRSMKAESEEEHHQPWVFVVFMIGIGTLLTLGPEFVYLRDTFGNRMNTIFKFYFATWILWGLAAAYATIQLWPRRWRGLEALRALVLLPLLIGLIYPVLSVWTKTNQFTSTYGPTLDGTAYWAQSDPNEYEAVQWINENLKSGLIAEAIGGSYTSYARISTHTGLSTILGWPGHELQWRGGAEEQGSRQEDINRLYTTRSWQEAQSIVDQYGIDYVYVGNLERTTYKPFEDRKFAVFMEPIFENGDVTIYARKYGGGSQ